MILSCGQEPLLIQLPAPPPLPSSPLAVLPVPVWTRQTQTRRCTPHSATALTSIRSQRLHCRRRRRSQPHRRCRHRPLRRLDFPLRHRCRSAAEATTSIPRATSTVRAAEKATTRAASLKRQYAGVVAKTSFSLVEQTNGAVKTGFAPHLCKQALRTLPVSICSIIWTLWDGSDVQILLQTTDFKA